MPRLFQIVPTISSTRRADGSVEHDHRVMYLIGEDAEAALDSILEPYDDIGAFYLDKMLVQSPGPWAYIALRQEYDISEYVIAQRDKMGGRQAFSFTIYDINVDVSADGFVPNVACFLFYSKDAAAAAAERIRFLQPAWELLRDASSDKHWLVLLDEDPASVLTEARNAL